MKNILFYIASYFDEGSLWPWSYIW